MSQWNNSYSQTFNNNYGLYPKKSSWTNPSENFHLNSMGSGWDFDATSLDGLAGFFNNSANTNAPITAKLVPGSGGTMQLSNGATFVPNAQDFSNATFNPETQEWIFDKFNNQSGFGLNLQTAGLALKGLQALTGLWNAYNGYNAVKQAKKEFQFQKGLANRNLANQAKTINNVYDNSSRVSAALMGESTDSSLANKYIANNKDKYVDGSPIG